MAPGMMGAGSMTADAPGLGSPPLGDEWHAEIARIASRRTVGNTTIDRIERVTIADRSF